jgi:ribulose-phosphate 3-epimerase
METSDKKVIEIVPAIIPVSLDDLLGRLSQARFAKVIQVDVTDGMFAGKRSWPLNDPQSFEPFVTQEEGLPMWESKDYEFDLIVANPALEVPRFASAGAARVVVHLGALRNRPDSLELVKQWRDMVPVIAGVGIEDDIADVEKVFGEVDGIQCMGIVRIGYQGQQFDERCFDQVRAARAAYPELLISVDGAVTDENARELVEAGADRLVVGSFLMSSGEEKERYELLTDIVSEQ